MLETKKKIELSFKIVKLLISNYDKNYSSSSMELEPYEALVVEIE